MVAAEPIGQTELGDGGQRLRASDPLRSPKPLLEAVLCLTWPQSLFQLWAGINASDRLVPIYEYGKGEPKKK